MKLNILYTINKHKVNSKGLCGITCRLTYNKKRKQFSTALSVNPKNWNSKQQLVEPPEPDEDYINTQLSLIRQKLNQAFLFLQVKGSPFDVMDIYTQYLGETPKDEMGVMEVDRKHYQDQTLFPYKSLIYLSFIRYYFQIIHARFYS